MSSQAEPLYQIAPIPGSGLGVTAVSHISRGDLILSESPLLTVDGASVDGIGGVEASITSSMQLLSSDEQREFLSLHNCYGSKLPQSIGIFKTNSIPLGTQTSKAGIFLKCSRFNHSCIPNAMYSWCSKVAKEFVYALSDIEPGEQIAVSYLDNECSKSTRSIRQLQLLRSWDFECLCEACAKSPGEIDASDRRRRNIARMDEMLNAGTLVDSNPAKALGFCQRMLDLWEEEGLDDISRYKIFYDAFQICVANGDFARASAFARLALKVKVDCEGSNDSSDLEEIKPFIEHPESHPSARTSRSWRSRTKDVHRIGSDGFDEWLWARVAY